MASRIKGITIEINGDTTGLLKSLKAVDDQLKNNRNSLRDINKLLKLNPGNTELLTQKQKALKEAIGATETRLEELKKAQSSVEEGSAEWDALQREIIDTENKLKSLKQEYADFGSVAAQKVAAVGEKMKALGSKMAAAGKELTMKLTLPLVLIGTKAASSFAEVDKTMQLTNKTMGNSEEEAKLLSDAMKEAAANSTFGMNDAATATLNFARAGLSAEQAAAALAPAMNLAAGEGGDLDTVSAGLVGTINGFGDSFENANDYADVFANACNNSALEINGLSDAMGVAAPVFRTAGYTVKDAALYLGVMADNNIDAAEGANALKTGLAKLIDPAKEGQEWMDKLGISVTNADGSMKDTITVQRELNAAFSTLSESEQIAAASAIFGKNQMSKWLALINTAPEDVEALSEALDQDGTTMEMAAAMMSGFGGSLEKLKSSLDVAITSLGEALAPAISKVADYIQKAVDWFNSLSDEQKQLAAKIGMVVAALGPALVVGGKVIQNIGGVLTKAPKLVKTIKTLGKGIKLLTTSALGPWVLAIGAAIAIGVLLYKNWDEIKAKAQELLAEIKTAFTAIKTAISTAWNNVKTTTVNAWNALNTTVNNAATAVKTAISNAWNAVKTSTSNAWNSVKTAISNALNGIKTATTNAWNNVKTATTNAWNNVKNAISNGITNAKNSVSSIVESIKSTMSGAWESIKSSASSAFENIKTAITSPIQSAKNTIDGIIKKIKGLFPLDIGNIFSNIKLPHFSIDWGTVEALGATISWPKGVKVSWYRKAMENAIMLNGATIFGSKNGKLLGGGEAGREVVVSYDKLAQMVGGGSTNINVVVNASPGMNEAQLADMVARRIQQSVNNRRAVWA